MATLLKVLNNLADIKSGGCCTSRQNSGALIEEEFGDGIMSAIDFDLELDRLANPKGDRVRLLMSGKFLLYKYYGAEQGLPEYGFKEE
jgi:hypothetical protein